MQLIVIYEQAKTSEPFLSWSFVASTLVIQCLGILTACVPYLKPFLQSLNSGMIGNDDIRRRGGSTIQDYKASWKRYPGVKYFASRGTGNTESTLRNADIAPSQASKDFSLSNLTGQARTEAFVTADQSRPLEREWDGDSHSSQANFIRQTTSYTVGSE